MNQMPANDEPRPSSSATASGNARMIGSTGRIGDIVGIKVRPDLCLIEAYPDLHFKLIAGEDPTVGNQRDGGGQIRLHRCVIVAPIEIYEVEARWLESRQKFSGVATMVANRRFWGAQAMLC